MPSITCFVPSDDVDGDMPENILKLEELEALRLKDLDGLDQIDCATRMAVSRPTFQRILLSAREKVADSLLHGKAIRIEGGVYVHIEEGRGYCRRCGRSWTLPASPGTGPEGERTPDPGTLRGNHPVTVGLTEDGQLTHGTDTSLCPACAQDRMGRGKGGGRGMGKGGGRGGRGRRP